MPDFNAKMHQTRFRPLESLQRSPESLAGFKGAFWGSIWRLLHILYIKLNIFRMFFSQATFASQIVCLYLQPLKSYKTSKLMMLQRWNIFRLLGARPGALPPHAINFLESSRRADVKL